MESKKKEGNRRDGKGEAERSGKDGVAKIQNFILYLSTLLIA